MTRIKEETNVSIKIPSDKEPSNIIRIEGSPEGVAIAKKELLEMVHKMVCRLYFILKFRHSSYFYTETVCKIHVALSCSTRFACN